MALIINKLFSSRKKAYNKHQDVCERTFSFSQDQVRVVLFRECDFRGRKLLFDSQSVQKIPVPVSGGRTPTVVPGTPSASPQMSKNEVFVEISNGYGYQYSRPSGDIVQLGEMVFGSVAMSFRGTSLKIHSFSNPAKLMCTQVFPSPRHSLRGRSLVTSHNFDAFRSNSSVHSFEKSLKLDYSSASSTTSFTEQTSAYSTESDMKTSGSIPLDVPASSQSMTSTKLAPSLEGDSGFCGEQSYSSVSVSSGPPSVCLWDSRHDHGSVYGGFSCGSLYKRWLRSASTSLDYNACSDSSLSAAVQSAVHSSASADECISRPHHRSSKLGLAVIIRFSDGQEIDLERFLLEHSALIEAMVCRARSGAEKAYTKPGSFASLMYEVFKETSQWLTDLITGPTVGAYLWHALGPRNARISSCDSRNRLSRASCSSSITETRSESALCDRTKLNLLSGSMYYIDSGTKKLEQNVRRSLFKPLTSDKKCARVNANFINDASLNTEKFVRELCELLEAVDTKHTNFFISTLLTAVLTHHLGWVSTVLPPSQADRDTLSKLYSPCNPLWGQLSDLYGAVGSPTKVAHTIVCGNSKADLISKILYTLTYFIRCSIVDRNNLSRFAPDDENHEADAIFFKDFRKPDSFNSSKLYDLKPNKNPNDCMRISDNFLSKTEELEMTIIKSNLDDHINEKKDIVSENKCIGLTRTKSCLGNLQIQNEPDLDKTLTNSDNSELDSSSTRHPLLDKVTSLGLSAANIQTNNNQEKLEDNFKMFDCYKEKEMQNLVDIKEASDQIRKVFHPKTARITKESSTSNLTKLVENVAIDANEPNNESDKENIESNVIFVLGDSDKLIGLKKMQTNNNHLQKADDRFNIPSCSNGRPKDLKFPVSKNKKLFHCESSDSSPEVTVSQSCHHSSSSETSPCSECEENIRDLSISQLRHSLLAGPSKLNSDSNKIVMTRSAVINLESESEEKTDVRRRDEFNRSQSVPPSDKNQRKCSKSGCKKKYSGVKFDFKQYPQIVTNYMKSKNLEMSQSPFSEKSFKLSRSFSASLYDCSKIDFPSCDCEPHSEETLQTPSNASELEFCSEMEKSETHRAREKIERKSKSFARETRKSEADFEHPLQRIIDKENNAIFEHDIDNYEEKTLNKGSDKMTFIELPMPRIITQIPNSDNSFVGYTHTLLRGIGDKYISDMVLQGTLSSPKFWEHILRRDLTLATRKPLLDQPVQEAVAIVANTDTWEVQLVSSHTYLVEKGSTGVRVGMSQLIANMLESLLHMWKLRTPPEYCLMHIESRLRELCVRSQALAQLLLTTEFCNMDLLTSTMQLEVNDVPLLMAVASTHTPQVTHKYGLSFQ